MAGKQLWRPTYALVDLENIRHNVRLYVDLVGPSCQVMAVVKADGYGHGDVETARAALQGGARRLGVALVEEAEGLLEAGLEAPVHLLFEPPVEAADRVVELGLVPSVYSLEFAEALSRSCSQRGVSLPVHLKVDTGMHRVGMDVNRASGMAERIARLPGLVVEGIYTHMAMASIPDHPFTLGQRDALDGVVSDLERRGINVPMRHATASGATLAFLDSPLEMVRLGIAMYGLLPGEGYRGRMDLRPALSLKTRISHVFRAGAGEGISYGLTHVLEREGWVAVLPLGYADGIPRALSNRWEVRIAGKLYPQVGTICMDLCMVELGDDYYPAGEEVTVIGGWGDEEIGVERMADTLGTINYEIVCGIGKRVPRLYLNRL
jgi:alanine racemase